MVYVIDEMMGRGKTTAMINFINQSDPLKRFIFITPYLTETKRIVGACANRYFFDPDEKGGKLNNIKTLITHNYNIVSTHALFRSFDDEALSLLEHLNYTLIMDETMTTAERLKVSRRDADIICANFVQIDEDKLMTWTDPDYTGKYNDYKDRIMKQVVYAYNSRYWIYMMEKKFFEVFDDVFVMTYMFKDQIQRCYFDMYDIRYMYKYIAGNSLDTYCLSDREDPAPRLNYKALIHIEDDPELNLIGHNWNSLSKEWYRDNVPYEYSYGARQMRRNLGIFFRKHGAKSKDVLWTCFKGGDDGEVKDPEWRQILSGDGYRRGFLNCTAKGMNEYRRRTVLAYLINRFPDPNMYNFLVSNGIEWSREFYALQEMLQWIWRSAIRDGHEIWVYIPSRRMRELLEGWMDRLAAGEPAFPADIQ